MPAEPKPPYKATLTLKAAKPEHVTAALTELNARAAEYDQTGETSATMVLESFREDVLQSVINAFETWLFYHGHAECEIKLARPGLRPETVELLAREKGKTPMDKEMTKLCRTCRSPLNRGAATASKHATHCLICVVAQAMRTFVYPPRKK